MNTTRWEQIARAGAGEDYAVRYAERFRSLAAEGKDTHGEAALVADLVAAPAAVLDAGCGTGRIATRLADLGYDVVGVDVDASMLDQARREAPGLTWRREDVSDFDLEMTFDAVVVAGNTLPLLEDGTLPGAARCLAAHLKRHGKLICGFGFDAAHLPSGCPVTPYEEIASALNRAGLRQSTVWSSWGREPFSESAGYAVTVHVPA